ncbi:MAG: NADH-quinone oxidoreductase subunit NuoE [Deltaproteobacteria bacterium]|nr:NADH-quinone oxidoreductase subunit NuoE [Deltaproteobacteria bacterium]MBW2215997.1 NADH-quinone oxidoreductase subunit NuoE [Deltaproteobacteria bacterium]
MRYPQNLEEVNADLTPDVIAQIDEIIERLKDTPGSLITVLAEAQGLTGYLPVELQEHIAAGMNIPSSTVYGVVTFYSFFSMIPKGRHIIKLCLGTACYVRGIQEVANRLENELNIRVGETTEDRRFTLEAVRCLGACGLAPVMVVDEDTHGDVTPETALKIVNGYE